MFRSWQGTRTILRCSTETETSKHERGENERKPKNEKLVILVCFCLILVFENQKTLSDIQICTRISRPSKVSQKGRQKPEILLLAFRHTK